MPLSNHSLVAEFPEYRNRIHELKATDKRFMRLFDEYDALDHEVHRIEAGAEATSDTRLESLKKRRLVLKDMLFILLKAA